MSARLRHLRNGWQVVVVCLPIALATACATVVPGGAGPGALRITSNPSGARIILDGAATNFRTPTAIPAVPPGGHRILLSLAGHRNWERVVQVAAGATTSLDAALEPAATGGLGVASVPAGAAVLLDGQPTGMETPADLSALPVGTHTVQLRRDGYDLWSQAVVVIPDRHLQIAATLAPSRKDWGHLRVQTHPPQARIALDGYPTGKRSPDTLFNVQAGSHRLELTVEGHRPWSDTVTVREGRTEDLLVKLQPLPTRELGNARIESDPPGASISLDGVLLRQRTPADLEYLAAGAIAVEVLLPGYRPWRGELAIRPGGRTPLAVKLAPEAANGGALRVESDPPGAAIVVDDRPTGASTPSLIPNLSPASHRLKLTLPGYRECVRLVTVPAGAIEQVRARLVRSAHRFTARVVAARGGSLELEFGVRDAKGGPAAGTLALFVASDASWQTRPAQVPVTGGVATVRITLAGKDDEASLTVGIEEDRATFRLHRAADAWEIEQEE
jgi:hypothetical protein